MLKPCQGPTHVVSSLPTPPSSPTSLLPFRVVPGSPQSPRSANASTNMEGPWGRGPVAFTCWLPWHGAGATTVAELGSPPTLQNCSEQTPARSCGRILPGAQSHGPGTEGQVPPGGAPGSHNQLYEAQGTNAGPSSLTKSLFAGL